MTAPVDGARRSRTLIPTMARIVRRPKRRTTAAIPEFFSSLTARDWAQIRAASKRLGAVADESGETDEDIVTSKGYVNVSHDGYNGFVTAHRFMLSQPFWPRAVKKARRIVRKSAR